MQHWLKDPTSRWLLLIVIAVACLAGHFGKSDAIAEVLGCVAAGVCFLAYVTIIATRDYRRNQKQRERVATKENDR